MYFKPPAIPCDGQTLCMECRYYLTTCMYWYNFISHMTITNYSLTAVQLYSTAV